MKTTRFFTLIILAFGFCSCSPKVHKHIIKEMHPVSNETEVTVYGIGDVVPENAEVIGNVSVLDGGFTTHCDWETVLETAKQEVRAAQAATASRLCSTAILDKTAAIVIRLQRIC